MRIAIFASGNGTNCQAIMTNAELKKAGLIITCVITDQANAGVIQKAKNNNVPVYYVNPKMFDTKKKYEEYLLGNFLKRTNVEYIILAGYMRLISEVLLKAYPMRILNIHPSLLPDFPGKQSIKDAYTAGVNLTGVTVHYIDSGVDTGPIIAQKKVDIYENDSLLDLEKRIHAQEHLLYPQVIIELINNRKM